jgi:internalin A
MISTLKLFRELVQREKDLRTGVLEFSLSAANQLLQYPSLFSLTWLKEIKIDFIGEENLLTLPSDLAAFSDLETFQIQTRYTVQNIKGLDNLSALTTLKHLTLPYCNISDISFLQPLSGLEILNVSNNSIENIEVLRDKTQLKNLNLRHNNIVDITALSACKELLILNLRENRITSIECLKKQKHLHDLDVGVNHIIDFTPIRSITSLRQLNISHASIRDISFLEKLNNLELLAAHYNKITDVQPLQNLEKLKFLNLSNNSIRDITPLKSLIDRTEQSFEDKINLSHNPLITPPLEIVYHGRRAIQAWFNTIVQSDIVHLQEIKILLVGEGLAGKTSLLKVLKGLPFSSSEDQTHGVNVERLALRDLPAFRKFTNLSHVTIHLWDFGGQEIMHASHQFFLSHRSIYILVVDSRSDSEKEYWLRHIQKFGAGSPCIIAINKIDENRNYSLEERSLNRKFPFIGNRIHKISCKNGEGIESLAKELADLIPTTELYKTLISESWFNIKEHLENETIQKKYIDRVAFLSICRKYGEEDEDGQIALLQYLNSLGIVLHFPNLHLQQFYVLDPHWVTIGIYKIINSPTITDGLLHEHSLDFILNTEVQKKEEYDPNRDKKITYSNDEQMYLVNIMEQFELLYTYDERRYLVPDLLPKELPHQVAFNSANAIIFNMDYDFLPPNVISRFILRMKDDILDLNSVWRTGVHLENKNFSCKALVTADTDVRRISIMVNGLEHRKREYFSVIRQTLWNINDSFDDLRIVEKLPVPGHPSVEVDYHELLGLEEMKENEIAIGRLGLKFNVSKDFLDHVSTRRDRLNESSQMRQTVVNIENAHFMKNLQNIPNDDRPRNNGMLSVITYLVAIIVIGGILFVFFSNFDKATCVLSVISLVLLLTVVGALQLRNDDRFSEKGFLSLMGVVLKKVPGLNVFFKR